MIVRKKKDHSFAFFGVEDGDYEVDYNIVGLPFDMKGFIDKCKKVNVDIEQIASDNPPRLYSYHAIYTDMRGDSSMFFTFMHSESVEKPSQLSFCIASLSGLLGYNVFEFTKWFTMQETIYLNKKVYPYMTDVDRLVCIIKDTVRWFETLQKQAKVDEIHEVDV